jgi:chromosome segregation ATPase
MVGLTLLSSLPAMADEEESGDLKQSVSDLSAQTDDKEKMDTLGATRVEVSQIRNWISDATNSIKEEAERKTRRIFERIRAQLKLVDQLIALSKVEDEASKLEQQVSAVKQKAAAAKSELEEKRAKLRALKMKEKGE